MTQSRSFLSLAALLLALAATAVWGQCPHDGSTSSSMLPKCCAAEPAACKGCGQGCCFTSEPKSGQSCSPCCSATGCCPREGTTQCCGDPCSSATGKEKEIERRLHQPICCNFKETPLRKVMEELSATGGLNMILDEAAMEDEGVSPERPVSLKLEQVSLRSALNVLLRRVHLTYVVRDEVLQITSESHARGKLVTRTFAVSEFLGKQEATCEKTAPDALMKLITNTVRPETWSDRGGIATMDFFPLGKALVVNQTADVHEQIDALLASLRRFEKEKATAAASPQLPRLDLPVCMPVSCLPSVLQSLPAIAVPAPIPMLPAGPYALVPPVMPPPPPVVPVPGLLPCNATVAGRARTPLHVWHVAERDGKECLECTGDGTSRFTCESRAFTTAGERPVKLTVKDKQVCVSGPFLDATADRLIQTEKKDRFVLKGHVRATASVNGSSNSIEADRVVICIGDGAVICIGDGALKVKSVLIQSGTAASTGPHVEKPETPFNWTIGISR